MMQRKIVFDALHKLQEVTAQGLTPTCVVTVSKGTVRRLSVIRRQHLLGSLRSISEKLSTLDFLQTV